MGYRTMHTTLDCVPCLVRQALDATRFVTSDPAEQESFLRQTLLAFSKMDMSQSPPRVSQAIHRQLRGIAQRTDPFRAAKDRFTKLALELFPDFEEAVLSTTDSFALATRIAIAANVIDLGVNGSLTLEDAKQAIDKALRETIVGDMDAFKLAALKAEKILFLLDNAGEIVFDRLLIDQLEFKHVTAAVRGGPILNDATIADALASGLDESVEIIENGSDAPGTLLDDCNKNFLKAYNEADLIISKGQGNYETLSDENRNIVFLFIAKCPMIASKLDVSIGTQLILQRRQS